MLSISVGFDVFIITCTNIILTINIGCDLGTLEAYIIYIIYINLHFVRLDGSIY